MNYSVSHPRKIIDCEINLPSSKSISNRLLIIQAICKEKFKIRNLSTSDDTTLLFNALRKKEKRIDVGSGGTTFRFLTAYLATCKGEEFILTGSKRIKERPIEKLVNALNNLGANISYVKKKGYAPLKIVGKEMNGGNISIPANISSQFISAILLISPTLKKGLTLTLNKKIVSRSYINMTLAILKYYGIKYMSRNNKISIPCHQKYIAQNYLVESDWSAASFWYEIAALTKNCNIKLNGLFENSIQGDKKVAKIFSKLSVSTNFIKDGIILKKTSIKPLTKTISLINTPDLYQPLACTLKGLNINCKLLGLNTLKDKETDRIKAIKKELEKVEKNQEINTYNDHRMAMCFAPLSLIYEKVIIRNPNVVTKSYPMFWNDLKKAKFKII